MVKCAQGGSDWYFEALVALCRRCHAQTDAPFVRGRLMVMPGGGGQFTFEVVTVGRDQIPSVWRWRHDPREARRRG